VKRLLNKKSLFYIILSALRQLPVRTAKAFTKLDGDGAE
jgi:hypothetical protein